MSMVYKCKECGGEIDPQDNGLGKCLYCGALQTLPKDKDDKIQNLLNRANDYRMSGDFDRAIYLYEEALKINEAEPETHWGLFLSKYGVEYVKDNNSFNYKPTLHRISAISVFDDIDYQATIKYANFYTAEKYKKDAELIEQVMKELLVISNNQEPYDIFLSYKEQDDITKQRTDDSHLAHNLYNELTGQGYKVFFAPKSLGAGLYEPQIYSAIISSKVMIVLGTKPEYFNAVWVKNEWSRFTELIENGEQKVIVPVYKYMEAYELPNKLAKYQAYNMDDISFLQSVCDTISKYKKKDERIRFRQDASAENAALERGFLNLEDRNFTQANNFFESVLNINPHNSQAYFGKLMAEMQISTQEQILTSPKPLNEYKNFEKSVRFADQQLKKTLIQYEQRVIETLDNQKYRELCKSISSSNTNANWYSLSDEFLKLSSVQGSKQKAIECLNEVTFSNSDELKELGEHYKKIENDTENEMADKCFSVSNEWALYDKEYGDFSSKYSYFPVSLGVFFTFGIVVVIVGLITLLWGFIICAGIVLIEFIIRLFVVSARKKSSAYKKAKKEFEKRKLELDKRIDELKNRK